MNAFTPLGIPPGMGQTYARMAAILVQREIVRLHAEGLDAHEIGAEFGATWGVEGSGPIVQVINFVIERTEAARERTK